MRGAVLAVGDELLLGDTVNTNAAWLGRQLAAAGVEVVASAAVGDDVGRLSTALRRSLEDADVVLLSGGLGPTTDDITRDVLALVAGVGMDRRVELEQQLRAQYAAYGFPMPDAVLRQADVPVGAEVLDNPVGTAPGLWLETGGAVVIALPGPPFELQATAAPVLARLAALSGTVVTTRTVHTAGIGESAVAQQVQAVLDGLGLPEGVALAYLAGGGLVRVRFTTSGDPDVPAPLVRAVGDALGDAVWGYDDDTLDAVVHELLAAAGQSVGVAESLTGGLLGAALSQRPGSSATFRGSLVVYATDLKSAVAGVPEQVLAEQGAVSRATALELATGARTRLGTDWGVGVTGVAGPSEQEGREVGTVHLAVAGPQGSAARQVRLPGDRERVRQLAVVSCLDLLRRAMTGKVAPDERVVL